MQCTRQTPFKRHQKAHHSKITATQCRVLWQAQAMAPFNLNNITLLDRNHQHRGVFRGWPTERPVIGWIRLFIAAQCDRKTSVLIEAILQTYTWTKKAKLFKWHSKTSNPISSNSSIQWPWHLSHKQKVSVRFKAIRNPWFSLNLYQLK